ncbi:CHAT domain-containing protein [soil metagenome]
MRADGSTLLSEVLRLHATDMGSLVARVPEIRRVARRSENPWDAWRALAICLRASGRYREAARAFDRAGETSKNPAYRLGGVDCLAQIGRYEESLALADAILGEFDATSIHHFRAKLARANTLLLAGRDQEAARGLEGVAERLEEPEASGARLARSSSALFGGDPQKALKDARAIVAPEGSTLRGLAEINAAYALVLLGRADEALIALEPWRGNPTLSAGDRQRVALAVGDASLALGMPEVALAAFAEARDTSRPVQNAHIALGEGTALRETGRSGDDHLKEAARRYRKLGDPNWEAIACALLDLPKRARALAAGPYARARIALCPSDPNPEEALRLVRRHGYGDLAWRAHWLKARNGGGLRAYRRMAEAILLERAARTTVAGRLAYLRDKEEALAEYFGVLLAKPTPARTGEALRLVTQFRAASLLDEVPVGPLGVALDALRARIGRSDWPFDRRGIETSAHARVVDLAPVRAALSALPARADTAVYARLPDGYSELGAKGARRIALSPEALRRRLSFLRYELLAPLADPEADPCSAIRALEALGKELGAGPMNGVSAEGALWSVPWPALTGAEIRLHPGMATDGYRLPMNPRVVIWSGKADGLASAPLELDLIRSFYPDAETITTAKEARERSGEFDLLCVVGHARRAANPMLSAVEFEDGPLFAAEIARLPATFRFALLAACDTGALAGDAYEPNGLARAFLARGARGVVASQWALDDATALDFARALYPLLSEYEPRIAVETARAWVRERRPHPYYWGGFALFAGKPQ